MKEQTSTAQWLWQSRYYPRKRLRRVNINELKAGEFFTGRLALGRDLCQTSGRSAFQPMNKETRNDRKIARSIAFISLHLNERITMTQLAERVGLSSSYFWALFRQKTGYAPIDFLIRLRMHQACQLLKSTDRPVNEIAAVLGYRDPLYFSRAFKSILGVAPTRYRGSGLDTMPLPPLMLPVLAK